MIVIIYNIKLLLFIIKFFKNNNNNNNNNNPHYAKSPLCRLCGEKGESVNHIVCECKKLVQREYKQRHA